MTNCASDVKPTVLSEKLIHPKVKAINGLWSICFLLMQQQLVMCNFCAPSKNLFAISECSKILLDELWKAVCAFGVCPKMCQGHPDTHKSQVPLEITTGCPVNKRTLLLTSREAGQHAIAPGSISKETHTPVASNEGLWSSIRQF